MSLVFAEELDKRLLVPPVKSPPTLPHNKSLIHSLKPVSKPADFNAQDPSNDRSNTPEFPRNKLTPPKKQAVRPSNGSHPVIPSKPSIAPKPFPNDFNVHKTAEVFDNTEDTGDSNVTSFKASKELFEDHVKRHSQIVPMIKPKMKAKPKGVAQKIEQLSYVNIGNNLSNFFGKQSQEDGVLLPLTDSNIKRPQTAKESHNIDVGCDQSDGKQSIVMKEEADSCVEDDVYDGIVEETPNPELIQEAGIHVEDDLYDGIAEETPNPELIQEELYDSILDEEGAPVIAPLHQFVKALKSFSAVDPQLFQIPDGLEHWLKEILLNKATFFNINNSQGGHDLIEEDVYDTIVQEEQVQVPPRPTKGQKKQYKDKIEQEKRDRKEKEKEKNERKKKKKEYGKFKLNIENDLEVIREVECKSCYKANLFGQLDLSYQIGDKLKIIVAPSCPDDKLLAMRCTDGKLGYVFKKTFEAPEEITCQQSLGSVSRIPTEDEEAFEQENYEEISTVAPPVPQTPRPKIAPPETCFDGEVYDSIVDEEENQIYEDM